MKPIPICHISTVHPVFDPRIFYRECRSLAKEGYEVNLVIPHTGDEVIDGIKIHALKRPSNRFKRIFFLTVLAFFKALKTKSKIYHLHDPELFVVGKLLRLMRKKVIFDIHENVSEQLKSKQWLPFRKLISNLYFLVDFFAAKLFYLIIAEYSYESKYKGLTSNYEIVLNTPDTRFFEDFYVEERIPNCEIFYIGAIAEERCIFEIVEAIYLLKKKIPEVVFHCVGAFPEHLKRKIAGLYYYPEIKSNLRFYGRLNLKDGYKISRKCSIGLALLKPVGNYVGSYPTKIFEYMSIGLPFLTSDFKLYREIVEEEGCGLCVDPESPKAIANQIFTMMNDLEGLQRMANAGRLAARAKYNWQVEEKKLLNVYRKLLSE